MIEARLDPSTSHFIFVTGRKGTGKSVLSEYLVRGYPYDELVVDITGDVSRGLGSEPGWQRLNDPLPARWPSRLSITPGEDDAPQRLIYVPDMGSKTYDEDIDQAVGLAYRHGRCLLELEEIGTVAPAGKTRPNMRRALHHGRHRNLTLVMNGPRPIDVDPLCVANADYVYVFDLPNPADRRRVADSVGWEPKEFDAAVKALPPFAYLRYDARAAELVEFPPLPYRKPVAQRPETDPTLLSS